MKIANAKQYHKIGVAMTFMARPTLPVGSWELMIELYGTQSAETHVLTTTKGNNKTYTSLDSVLKDIRVIDPETRLMVNFGRVPVDM